MIRRILCVCFGNSCRSPMLQVLLQAALQKQRRGDVLVESAGVDEVASTHQPASEHAIACMDERGLELRNHRSRRVSEIALTGYDLILVMDSAHIPQLKGFGVPETTAFAVVNEEHGGVPNPYQKGLEAYQETAKVLEEVASEIVRKYL